MTSPPPHLPHLPAGTAPGSVDLAAGGTLPAVWQSIWAAHPDRPVVHDPTRGWVTGAHLTAAAARLTEYLAGPTGLGVSHGDRVLLSGPTSADLVIAHAALLAMGAVVVPVNGAYRRDELAHIVRDAAPTAALIHDDDQRRWVTDVDPDVAAVPVAPAHPPAPTVPPSHPPAPADPAMIGYTSGTTGRPKGAVLSHANLLAAVRALELAWRWTDADVLVLTLPLFHMHGLGVGLHGTLGVGARAVLLDGFSPDAVLDAVAGGTTGEPATMFFGVPTMYERLASSSGVGAMSALRLCVSGSAPLPAQTHRRFGELTGQAVLERYGMTETAMLVSNPFDGERRPGTVGFPLPGVELRLADDGEIQVRGPSVFAGYWRRPDAAAAPDGSAFVDGWFRTGDLGHVDDDGYVSLVGRSKDLVISGGYNVHPREVEEAVAGHPDVAECAVGGEPDPDWGEAVTAYVVVRPECGGGVGRAELRRFLGTRLAGYKHPQRVYAVDALPRNALGKVQRHRLAESAAGREPVE